MKSNRFDRHSVLVLFTILMSPLAVYAQNVPTYSEHIAPILNTHCVNCHRPDGIAPFGLDTFSAAQANAERIAEVVTSASMPPWKPAPYYGPFEGEPEITVAETDNLVAWATNGAPRGDTTATPTDPTPSSWSLGEPDLIISMEEAYPVNPGDSLEHRNFVLPVDLTERQWVRAVDILPNRAGNAAIRRGRVMLDGSGTGRTVEAEETLPGYPGLIIDHAAFPQGHILVWSPGQTPTAEQPGLAWSLEPGTDLILQLTLQPRPETVPVQASIGLYFTDEAPALRPVGLGLNSKAFEIPAGNSDFVIQDRYRLPVGVDVLELFPYMHYLGKTVEVTATLPDGTEVGLLQIEDWDFNWQDSYRYAAPVHLPAGTSIEALFTFDNSSTNPRNPSSPPVVVRHGETMMDEMAEVLMQVLPVLPGDTEALIRNLVLKEARNDIIGLQAQLRNDSNNAVAHNDLGVRYLDIGQLQLARDHFGQAITIDPGYAEPHFNLGSLLITENNTEGAIEELRRAVEIAPDYAEAHNNLGGLLSSVGLIDDAVIYYRLAIQFNPRHSEALYNLGNVMLSRGNRVAAMQHYRNALRYAPNDAEVHSNLARALTDENELDDAVMHYQSAIEINPELAPALIGLAWIRATASNPSLRRSTEALMLAEQTVRLVGAEHPEVLDTLAAAYAAEGRFDDAVTTAQKAAAAARVTPGYESTATAIDERVNMYILFKPYRTP